MSLLHVDPRDTDRTLDDVLHAVLGNVPSCRGNCDGGRRPCTLPGVCTLRARCRTQRRRQPAPVVGTTDADPTDALYTPGDARATRWLLIVIVITVAATAWLIAS